MTAFLDKLPTTLVLAVLVGTFLILRKHTSSVRVRLWTFAWALIFTHFFVQAFETHTGVIEKIFESIDLAALELSGLVFAISLMREGASRFRQIGMLAVLGIPTALHAFAITFGLQARWALAGAVAIVALGSAAYVVFANLDSWVFGSATAAVLLAAGGWAVKSQLAGSPDFAVNAVLTLSFGLCGVLFWRRYLRRSPGVIIVSGGFLSWGAVFPVANALAYYMPKLQVNPELWNVPKFFVAFGMVLTLIEEKSRIIEAARERERAENRLLTRLAQVSSRLLAGKDPARLCDEIATAITEASGFSRAALFLAGERKSLQLAGASGLSRAQAGELQERAPLWTSDDLRKLCTTGKRAGNASFLLANAHDEILIPLVSCRGSHLGCLWLGGARNRWAMDESQIVKLEMLSSDLSVTLENSRLHDRLVRSEKLAALGQLVAGVAHELNNPLAGIMGYAELLGEEAQDERSSKRIQKLANEGRRMKRIVDGLLRFARQSNPAARAGNLEPALRDVVHLREYHLRKFGIRVEISVEPGLPGVALGEDELKQVLLNVLGNAVDAVEESAERKIHISASRQHEMVVVQFEDSGPGFTEVNRALDPFYTTKPVGKGTGLGLSICYGIMQECGGDISLANKEPYGACVTLEFPTAASQIAQPALLSA